MSMHRGSVVCVMTAGSLCFLAGGCVANRFPASESKAVPRKWNPQQSEQLVQETGTLPRPEVSHGASGTVGGLGSMAPSLAFSLEEAGTMYTQPLPQVSLRPTTGEAGFLDPQTVNVSRVTFADEGADFDPSLSRDGNMLVYASTQHRTTSDIYIKRVDSRVTTRLTNDPGQDMMPKFSPDGSMIAFASDRSGNWDIYVMPVTGGKAIQVTQGLEHDIAPSWSPDGTQLVYSRMGQSSARWEMWVANVDNPDVANFLGYGLFPQWSPVAGTGAAGSDQILFQLGRERGRRSFGIWTLDIAQGKAGNIAQIAGAANEALINPCWSPDGRWIIYAQVPLDQIEVSRDDSEHVGPSHAALWMVSSEGEGSVRLTTGTGSALSPAWTKNDRLFFVSNRDGVDNVWAMDLHNALATANATIRSNTALANVPKPDASVQPAEVEDDANMAAADEDQ